MPRPVKWRKIEFIPIISKFGPLDPQAAQGENALKLEELEAIRLKDMEGLEQEVCADRMEISRPTFQRILLAARIKIADSLIYGRIIRIEGGNYTRSICTIHCLDCGREWNERIENLIIRENPESNPAAEPSCPKCHARHWECCSDKNHKDNALCRQVCRQHTRK
ncbi:MAG: DUF134 domain-containing protein [Clostridiaceae bacterium]|nr:DUF134 domain-containing protein [Clostridiaceae bacterium]